MSEINERIKIQDLPIFISDGNYSSKYPKNEEMVLDGIPFVRSNNIKRNIIIWDDMKYISEEKHSQLLKGHLKTNDVLITVRGDVGNVAVVSNDFEDANINAQIALLRVENRNVLNPKYLLYSLKEPETIKKIERHQTGTALKQLPIGELKKIDIFVQNIVIQEKIVKVLDKAQELIDKRKEQIEALDELVKSKFIEMFGAPINNPKSWDLTTMDKVIDVIGGYAFKSTDFADDGIPVLKIGNINSGYFKPTNLMFWEKDDKLERYLIKPGDLVISLTGTVGKDDYGNVCIMGTDYDEYYLNQRNAKLEIKSTESFNKYYLTYLLKVPEIKQRLTGISRGVRQANISNKDILNLEVPNPPIELQNKFEEFVKQIDKLKFEMEKSLKELEDNFNSLMQKAFKGELFN